MTNKYNNIISYASFSLVQNKVLNGEGGVIISPN